MRGTQSIVGTWWPDANRIGPNWVHTQPALENVDANSLKRLLADKRMENVVLKIDLPPKALKKRSSSRSLKKQLPPIDRKSELMLSEYIFDDLDRFREPYLESMYLRHR